MPRHPGRGGEGRQGEQEGIARHGWFSALPSPPGREKEDGEEDEAGRMADGARRCPVAAGRCRSVARWWQGVAMTSPRARRGGRPPSRPGCWCDGGEVVSAGDGADGGGNRQNRKGGEERAKRSAAFLALVLSLPGLSPRPSLPCSLLFFLYI